MQTLFIVSKHPSMDLIFKLKIGPKLEDQLPKVGGLFSVVMTINIWRESDAELAPLYVLMP